MKELLKKYEYGGSVDDEDADAVSYLQSVGLIKHCGLKEIIKPDGLIDYKNVVKTTKLGIMSMRYMA